MRLEPGFNMFGFPTLQYFHTPSSGKSLYYALSQV